MILGVIAVYFDDCPGFFFYLRTDVAERTGQMHTQREEDQANGARFVEHFERESFREQLRSSAASNAESFLST